MKCHFSFFPKRRRLIAYRWWWLFRGLILFGLSTEWVRMRCSAWSVYILIYVVAATTSSRWNSWWINLILTIGTTHAIDTSVFMRLRSHRYRWASTSWRQKTFWCQISRFLFIVNFLRFLSKNHRFLLSTYYLVILFIFLNVVFALFPKIEFVLLLKPWVIKNISWSRSG